MLYLSGHFYQKVGQHAKLLQQGQHYIFQFIGYFVLSLQSNFVFCCCAAKTVNKQGYIHASYQMAEMAFFEYYE